MHLIIILATLTIAYWIRRKWTEPQGTWNERWWQTLFVFLFPPLLLFMTAIAVLCMGPQGQMGGIQTGWFSYVLTWILLGVVVILWLKLVWEGQQSVNSARRCALVNLEGRKARLLETGALFAGQIGFWQSELVISKGLLKTLSPKMLETVLAHEQGHYYYRDTFWFFWLGWVRSWTSWLPQTEVLWQELLVLRELRADAYAASRVDPLLLAESLLLVVSSPPVSSSALCVALGSSGVNRLEQRIDALLAQQEVITEVPFRFWNVFLLALLPLVTIMFHSF